MGESTYATAFRQKTTVGLMPAKCTAIPAGTKTKRTLTQELRMVFLTTWPKRFRTGSFCSFSVVPSRAFAWWFSVRGAGSASGGAGSGVTGWSFVSLGEGSVLSRDHGLLLLA